MVYLTEDRAYTSMKMVERHLQPKTRESGLQSSYSFSDLSLSLLGDMQLVSCHAAPLSDVSAHW